MNNENLIQYLEDEKAVNEALAALPMDCLSEIGQANLYRLYRHMYQQETEVDVLARSKENRKKRKRSPEIERFKNISTLAMPPSVLAYMQEWGTDPSHFMDCKALVHGATQWPDNAGDTFVDYYNYTKELIGEEGPRNVRYLFQMLTYFDIGELVMTTKGMGHRQLVAIETFLENIQVANSGINVTAAARNVVEWWGIGSKVNILCRVFGPGCLFFLSKELSENFLKTKLRASGPYHTELISHLQNELGLVRLMAETQAGQLGENLRAHLIKPFADAAPSRTVDGRG